MIKALIFDCFGVLTADTWVEFCSTLPKGEVLDTARRLNHKYDSGLMSLEDFLDQTQKVTNCDYQVLKKLFTEPSTAKNTALIEYIAGLKDSYKIGILSNVANNWVREVLLDKNEQELFDVMVFSYEVGTTKPDPRAYEAILTKLGVLAQEAVFIDDQPRYCEAAQSLGMQAVRYQDFGQMKTELEKLLA